MKIVRPILLSVLITLLVFQSLALAQSSETFVFHEGATASGDGKVVTAEYYSTIVVQIEGTFTGQVLFKKKTKDSSSWASVQCVNSATGATATSASQPGYWDCPGGAHQFKAEVVHDAGTIIVTGLGTIAVTKRGGGGGGSSGPASAIQSGESLPETCSVGQVFLDTDAGPNAQYQYCIETDTWVPLLSAESQSLQDVCTVNCTIGTAITPETAERVGSTAHDTYHIRHFDEIEGLIDDCEVEGVVGACDKVTRLKEGYVVKVKDHTGTDIFVIDNDTGLTTFAKLTPLESHAPVASCQGSTAQAVFDLPASNAPAPACDTGTNTQKGSLAFDASTDESFQDHWILPAGFQSVDVHFRWKAAATSGATGWCAQLIRVPDGATSDPAFPAQATGNCVSDTVKGTTLQENTATITGVTCTDCVAGDHVYARISRDANGSAVTDDMAGDAFLLSYGRTVWVHQ